MTTVIRPFALLAAGLAASACTEPPLTGPPTIRVGSSQCAECGMIISEERHASALLIDDRGRRDYLLYDDIGCMLDDENDGLDGPTVLERHVHDHQSRAWARADLASFVMVDPTEIPTPMGSGIVAVMDAAAARELAEKHKGQILDYPGARAARKRWMQERYGPREPSFGQGG